MKRLLFSMISLFSLSLFGQGNFNFTDDITTECTSVTVEKVHQRRLCNDFSHRR